MDKIKDNKTNNYWTFKHKPGTDGGSKAIEYVERAIFNNSALMQYEYGSEKTRQVTQNWKKIKEIQAGDIIFLRGDENIHAVGQVISPRKQPDKTISIDEIIKNKSHGKYLSGKYEGCIHFQDSEVFYEDLSEGKEGWGQRIDVDGWKFYNKNGIDAVGQENYIDRNNYGVLKKLKSDKAENFLNQLKSKFMGHETIILENNKNLILTGAPGTGKTYLAKQIALKMIFGKDSEKLLTDEEKELFKERFCFVQFHPSYDYTDFVEGLRPIKKEEDKELGFELKNGIFKEFCKKAKDDPNPENNKYVFIIDEINRAEISKVFGELFFAIDPGYRGVEGKVKTQYANMQTKETRFNEKDDFFYVPENVFIIGTMNDIDRSVESFDFAMRRRFAWKEIKANERIEMLNEELEPELAKKAINKMKQLNEAIYDKDGKGIEGLNRSYHIGPAYFLKLKNYDGDFEQLWENHLEVLLREYLRGMPKPEDDLKKLRDAYNLKSSNKTEG